jgi:chlorobactene glucosyltransferase
MDIFLSLSWVALVVWLICRAVRQSLVFPVLETFSEGRLGHKPSVAVIVPARDERANIGPCVASVLTQDLPPERLRVVVVDDQSSDGTGKIVEQLARSDSRVTLVRAPALPAGWTGKAHACWCGAGAVSANVEWLCFLDADMRAQPELLSSALHCALESGIDLLSLAPQHELRSFAERLILPCGLYLLAFSQNLARVQASGCPDAVATGQFMLIHRAAYDAADGFRAVRNRVCEDVALARLMKSRGYRVLMQDGSALLSTRMYTGWRTLWPGLAKNASEMLGGAARTMVVSVLALVLAWIAVLLPAAQGAACAGGSSGACIAVGPAALASVAVLGLHLAGAAHFGVPLWYGLLFPFGYSVGALIAFDSIRWRLVGRVRWKGRVYP